MDNFITRFFKPKEQKNEAENFQQLLSNGTRLSTWSASEYENDVFRSGVDAIARNSAKLKPSYFIADKEAKSELNYLLQNRPNPYMSTYDFLYKITTHYYLYNNAFILIHRDKEGKITGFYPVQAQSVQFGTVGNSLYCLFNFKDGYKVYLPYADLIHLRRNFNSNELLGDSNSAVNNLMEVSHYQNQGVIQGIKLGANIRGIVQFNQLQNQESIEKATNEFVERYFDLANNGGVIGIDQKADYTPIDSNPQTIDKDQMKYIAERIYNYLGISENIVNSSYTEDGWASFYESVIESISTQLSLEFTEKCFTKLEKEYGHRIIFESSRLQFSSNKTKIDLVATLIPNGLITINQGLEILNMPKTDDEIGDKRLMTLNYVDTEIADQYQLKGATKTNEGNTNSTDTDTTK